MERLRKPVLGLALGILMAAAVFGVVPTADAACQGYCESTYCTGGYCYSYTGCSIYPDHVVCRFCCPVPDN